MQSLRRNFKSTPSIDDIDDYASTWWKWWASIQPEWRTSGNLKFRRNPPGSWSVLAHPGKNGMLIVIMSLVWWADALADANDDHSWKGAVNDVAWVLSQMGATEQNTRNTKKRARASEVVVEKKHVPKRRRT